MAFVRLRYPTGNYRPFHALLDSTPEIIEAHHVTGEDCFVLKVLARSMRHLEEVTGRIAGLGAGDDERGLLQPAAGPRPRDLGGATGANGGKLSSMSERARGEAMEPGSCCCRTWPPS